MFFSPTGIPLFLTRCSGFNGYRLIFLSFASVIDISMALLNCAYSSCGFDGFLILYEELPQDMLRIMFVVWRFNQWFETSHP